MATKNLVIKFLGRDSSLQAAFRRARKALRSFNRATRGLRTGLLRLGIVGAAAGVALAAIGVNAINQVDKLSKLSEALGESVENLQLFELAMELGGGTLDGFQKAVQKVGKVIGKEFVSPTKETADALAQLGVSTKDLKGLSAINLFKKLLPLVLKLKGAKLDAVGSTLFGRGFQKDLAAFKQFNANLVESVKTLSQTDLLLDTKRAVAVFTDAFGKKTKLNEVETLVRLKDEWKKLTDTIAAFAIKIVAALGPTMLIAVNNLLTSTQAWLKEMGGGGEAARKAAKVILEAMPPVIEAFKLLGSIIGSIFQGLSDAFAVFNKFKGASASIDQAQRRRIDSGASGSIKGIFGERVEQVGAVEAILEKLTELFDDSLTEQQEQTRLQRGGFSAGGAAS